MPVTRVAFLSFAKFFRNAITFSLLMLVVTAVSGHRYMFGFSSATESDSSTYFSIDSESDVSHFVIEPRFA